MLESVLRCFGSVLIFILALFFRWWEISAMASIVPILAFLCCFLSPESPVFLVKKGRHKEAEESMERTFGPDFDYSREVGLISTNIDNLRSSKSKKRDYIRNIGKHPEIYKPFMIIIFLSLVQQFSGMSVIRAYVVKIFDNVFSHLRHSPSFSGSSMDIHKNECSSDVRTNSMAYISAIVIGTCRLIASLALAKLLREYPRRAMYGVSLFLTIISLLMFSSSTLVTSHPYSLTFIDIQGLQWISLVSVCILVFSVQLGVQTLPLLFSGELFPADVRASCKVRKQLNQFYLKAAMPLQHF